MIKFIDQDSMFDEVFLNGILKARSSVHIATANVKDLHGIPARSGSTDLPGLMGELVSRCVEIKVLHSGIPSSAFMNSLREQPLLIASPLFEMKRCMRVHMKAVMIDSRLIYIGSANLTGAGLGAKSRGRRNFEIGILTDQECMVDSVADLFFRIWEGDECRACRRRDICVVPLETPFD